MKSVWELLEGTIIPIITYGCEVWDANKAEMKALNSLLDNILKMILMTPPINTKRDTVYRNRAVGSGNDKSQAKDNDEPQTKQWRKRKAPEASKVRRIKPLT